MNPVAATVLLFVGNLMLMVHARTLTKTASGPLKGAAYVSFILFGLSALVHAGILVERILKLTS